MEHDSDAHKLADQLDRQALSKGQDYFCLFREFGTLDRVWEASRPSKVSEDDWKRLRKVLEGGERFRLDNPDTVEVYLDPTSSASASSRSELGSAYSLTEVYHHEQAWKGRFRGQAPEVLLERLSLIAQESIDHKHSDASGTEWNERAIYARYLPIVQSSGTGKSRLVEEISSAVFVVPLNVRAVWGGFPPPDLPIIDFFEYGVQKYPGETMTILAAFWIALCDTLRINLRALGTTPAAWKDFFTKDMCFTGHNAQRIALYDSVRRLAEQLLPLKISDSTDGILYEDQPRTFEAVILPNGSLSSATSTEAAAQLNAVLRVPIAAQRAACIVIAIDEFHHLLNLKPGFAPAFGMATQAAEPSDSMLSCFRRSLRAFPETPLVAVVLSTALSIGGCLPTVPLNPLHRNSPPSSPDASHKPLVPFHLLDWDQTLDAWAVRREPLDDMSSIVYFGRPLFGSLFKAGHDEQNILRFAYSKLVGILVSQRLTLCQNHDQCLAVIGSILPLQLSLPSQPSDVLYNQQIRQVERHMAVLQACHPSLGLCVVARPSEPVLAMAAAYAIMGHLKNPRIPLLLPFTRLMMPQGERGEVLAMYMLVMARHRVMSQAIAERPEKAAGYLQPVGLLDFMQQLNANVQAEHLPAGATVRLLQFIKVVEPKFIPSPPDLLLAYHRCCGFACANNRESIDLIVPICYSQDQQDLSPSMMSCICIQVKNDAGFTGGAQEEVMEKIDLFVQGLPQDRPCVQLLLNLGVQRTPKTQHPPHNFHRASAAPQQGRQQEVFQLTLNGLRDIPMLRAQGAADSGDTQSKFTFGTVKEAEFFLRFSGPPEKSATSVLVGQKGNPLAGSGRGHSAFGEGL